jgi:pilus assembly protein CpaB
MNWKDSTRPLRGPNAVLLLVAALAGWGSMASASRYLDARVKRLENETRLQYKPRSVIVAKQDLQPGTALSPEVMSVRQMPSGFLPADVLDGNSGASLLGRHLSVALRSGDPVTERVLRPRFQPSLASVLPEGQRALTVAVDEVNSLSGMLTPGDRVDLYLSRGQGEGGARLALLLEQAQVLATGNEVREGAGLRSGSPSGDYSTVTLLVDAEQAGRIILAQRTGSLSVALRPVSDKAPSQLRTRDSRNLLLEGAGIRRSPSQDFRIELLLGGYGGPSPRRELLLPGKATNAEDRS